MSSIHSIQLPSDALLQRHCVSGAYTDCYTATVAGQISLADFIAAFYTTPVFKLERWLLARWLRLPSTDAEAQQLAQGERQHFSAWQVECRQPAQVILAAGRTRSWLMTSRLAGTDDVTVLFFGSAIVPRQQGGLGWPFNALLFLHRIYSRILFASALRRLARARPLSHAAGGS